LTPRRCSEHATKNVYNTINTIQSTRSQHNAGIATYLPTDIVMRISFIPAVLVALISSPCDAFPSFPFVNQANPAVAKYADAQISELLKIHLDIGQQATKKQGAVAITGDRLGVDGLVIKLLGKEDANYKHPNLPGANGPNPHLSSGAKTLELLQKGSFVDFTGSRTVDFENGVWEMIWRKNAKAGAFICAFDVPLSIKRNELNEAIIPGGRRLYLTFPIWTQETLDDLRERKVKAEETATEAIDRLKDETRKMGESTNLLTKALHWHSAMKAHEDIEYSGHRNYQKMPIGRDMIGLKGHLHLCSLGTVWMKKDGMFGEQVLLGSATASPGEGGKLTEKKALTERELAHLSP